MLINYNNFLSKIVDSCEKRKKLCIFLAVMKKIVVFSYLVAKMKVVFELEKEIFKQVWHSL